MEFAPGAYKHAETRASHPRYQENCSQQYISPSGEDQLLQSIRGKLKSPVIKRCVVPKFLACVKKSINPLQLVSGMLGDLYITPSNRVSASFNETEQQITSWNSAVISSQ